MIPRGCLKYFTVLFNMVLMVIFASCETNEPGPKVPEPDYMDYVTGRVGDLHHMQGSGTALGLLDSIRNKYYDRSVRDKFHIQHLYSDYHNRHGVKELAEKHCDTALAILKENNAGKFSYDYYLWAYFFKADLEINNNNLDTAYEYFYKAHELAYKYDDHCGMAYYYLRVGQIVFKTHQYYSAANYFKNALTHGTGCKNDFFNDFRLQQIANNVGLSYEREEVYDSAIHYYNLSLSIIAETEQKYPDTTKRRLINTARGVVYGNKGGVYAKVGMEDSAEYLLKKSVALNSYILNDPWDAQFSRVKLANLYTQQNKLKAAAQLLNEVATINDTLEQYQLQVRWYKAKWKYYEKLGNESLAYDYLKRYNHGSDSLYDSRLDFSLMTVDAKIKSIGDDYKIATLKGTADLRKTLLIAALLVGGLAIIIVVLSIRNLKTTRENVIKLKQVNDDLNTQKEALDKAMAELEEANNEKDRILKAVSHDMRSPINSSLALVDILGLSNENFTEEQKEFLSLIKTSNENALNLTTDLLEFAKLNTEQLEKESTDINSLIADKIKLLQFKAAEKEQKIIYHQPENHISARVNAEKITRVINNLVTNAIKFSPVKSDILVTLQELEDDFVIRVKDSGIGIPKHLQKKVFDLFSEAKRFGTSGEQPFGLGLSITKQIVEVHNGTIDLESEEGEGAEFIVTIPQGW